MPLFAAVRRKFLTAGFYILLIDMTRKKWETIKKLDAEFCNNRRGRESRMDQKQRKPSFPRSQTARFTKTEKSWILYDWANSVYATNMMAAIFPIYYAGVAGDAGDKWWGIGVSAASLVVAVLAPLLGSIGDSHGMKKRFFTFFLLLGVAFTALTAFVADWKWMLLGYVLSHIGFSGANVFYDSFLTDVTDGDRMDKVSAWGYAMGYLGGSTIPFVISIALLLLTGFSVMAVKASILITCVWWALFSLPFLRNVHQVHGVETPPLQLARGALRNLWGTMRKIGKNRGLLLFMVAYFFYIDGVGTVISLATNYGATLGLGSTGMIIALLVTQLVAVPCSILFSRLAERAGAIRMITVAIAVYFGICGVGFFMGVNVEPYQLEYASLIPSADEAVPSGTYSAEDDVKAIKLVLDDLREDGKNALSAADRSAAFYTVEEDGTTSGVIGNALTRIQDASNPHYAFTSNEARVRAAALVEELRPTLLAFASDTAKQAEYTKALALSSLLFWLMAVLVGTVQGGIQALSRSYFGRLIPAKHSNEYFGFFDIFGKFAAVIGPFLYSAFYMATGRASIGILSLMLLFLIGGLLLTVGRRSIRTAEESAAAERVSAAAE
mgnify:CR=1 FL=1